MINIFKGDSTIFADVQKFLVFHIDTALDLKGWQAIFTLGDVVKTIDDITSKTFEVVLTSEDTEKLIYGHRLGTVKLKDSQSNLKTICNNLEFNVTDHVVSNESQTIYLDIASSVPIDLYLQVGPAEGSTDVRINDNTPSSVTVYSSAKIEEILRHPQYNNMKVTVVQTGLGDFVANYTSGEIRDFVDGGGKASLYFDDTIRQTGEQVYEYQNYREGVAYFRRPVLEKTQVSRINIGVHYNKKVQWEEVIFDDYYTKAQVDAMIKELKEMIQGGK